MLRSSIALTIALLTGAGSADAIATPAASAPTPATFSAAELDAYARGIAQEAALVRAARERGRAAKTPAERSAAAQQEWESATIAGGAQAAGLAVERYRAVRSAVHHVLQTLDFQGRIDGPQEIDVTNASPEMKRRLASDAFAELAPASATALRARLVEISKVYVAYMELTAVNG